MMMMVMMMIMMMMMMMMMMNDDDDPQVPQQPLPVCRGPGGAGAWSGAGRESGQHLVPEPEVTVAQLARHAGAHLLLTNSG